MTTAGGPLLERDPQLTALASYWSDACAGNGRLVFLGGEAGSGKTALSLEFGRRIASRARFLVGTSDAGSTPRPLGPLLDVADQLQVSASLDERDVQRGLLFPRVRAALGRTPTLLLFEDVHWSDEATLDLLRYLGRRMDGLTVLLLVTFRDDEVVGTHPVAALMGDLATMAQVRRLQLPLLTVHAVTTLAEAAGRNVDAAALHHNTNGNPFFVTEVLAADTGALPTSVRDAVVARFSRLSHQAQSVLRIAAVVGLSSEISLVLAAAAEPPEVLDECVRGGMLTGDGLAVRFRHELARQSVLDATAPAGRADLHRRVLSRLEAAGSTDHRRLADHATACADAAAVLRYAPLAARRSARLGAHREALEQWSLVLRHGDCLDDADRAEALENFSYECLLVSFPGQALSARQEALALREALSDTRRVGIDQRWLSRILWFLGRNAEANRYAVAAVATLAPLGASADLAMAYSNLSNLRMLNGDADEALDWGRRARSAGAATGSREVEAHALNNIGVALLLRGEEAEGGARLAESLAIALTDDLDEQAARAYANIGAMQVIKRRLSEAQQTLTTGIAYCDERDLDQSSLYMRGWLAGVLIEQGGLERGLGLANHVLARPHLSATNRMTALLPAALVSLRTGQARLRDQLTLLGELAAKAPEPLRLLPLALLHAEAAWTDGHRFDIVTLTDPIWSAFASTSEPWILAELAWWRRLGGATDAVSFPLPEPFALMRDGRAREASTAWTAVGRPFWSALALATGSPHDAAESVTALLRMGAPATANAVRRDLAAQGRPVPRGPRSAARNNPAGLTARELDVLAFLVEGRSDAEIATTLTLSERTVSHHVSAVLRKLSVPSRARAAATASSILMPLT